MSENFHNPALKSQPRSAPAPVIAVQRDTSILEWLQQQGRLIDRDDKDVNLSVIDRTAADDDLFDEDNYHDDDDVFGDDDDDDALEDG
jgi:hypothetical protein